MNKDGLEIERKFLIEYPDIDFLLSLSGCAVMKISQSYLEDRSRIRKIEQDGKTYYIRTVKQKITEVTRKEREWQISEEEYFALLKTKQKDTVTVNKIRYAVKTDGFVYEIDVFDFLNDKAFLEIELKDEKEDIVMPSFIKVIKEVTFDSKYKNYSLAKGSFKDIV
ncbi:MAG: hypothetical protein E7568_03810 [Ruminococcaceae bacterium]|nr:hypothetical protein [Oscillospiraceae bacterium]